VAPLLLALACNTPSSPGTGAPPPRTTVVSPNPGLPQVAADPREKVLAQGIKMLLETEHLRHHAIDDGVSKKAFGEYLEALDPGKFFLLESDVAELRRFSDQLDDELAAGDLELARVGAAMMRNRQEVVAKVVADVLAKPFDLDVEESVETDPKKRSFVASEEQLRDRWRKALKLQVLERIERMDEVATALDKAKKDSKKDEDTEALAKSLGAIPPTFEGREAKARDDLAKSYAGRFSRLSKLEPLEPSETFLNAITAVFDPHTTYLAPAEKDNFDIQMSGSLEGIGAVLSEDDHYISVREIVPGGASWRQGQLEAGDLILAVAQAGKEPVDVADMRINQVVQMIRGPKGSVVSLTVKKPDDRVEVISITRDVIEIEAAYAKGAILSGGGLKQAVGYIALPSFYGNTRAEPGMTGERNAADDLQAILRALTKKHVGGVIIDLRGNGGGLLEHARLITGMFISTGPVVQTQYPNEKTQILADEDPDIDFRGEVVVLVDRFSASASEIVAGALQDYHRAVIVGTGTHGKGTVQMLVDLDRLRSKPGEPLGVLKLTIQQFFRINGDSTQWRGVVPDIELPNPVAHLEAGEQFLHNAIPWTEVESLKFNLWPGGKWNLKALAAASQARQKESEAFTKIGERTAYLISRRDDTVVPLARKAWMAKRKKDRDALEAADPKLEEGPERFTIAPIDYAGTSSKAGAKAEAERVANWKKGLARDPWVDEARHIIGDMLGR